MSNDRRLSGPGQLAAADVGRTGNADVNGAATAGLPDMPLAELAALYKLRPSAERPRVFAYLVSLWQRRHFIMAFATARNVAMYTEARLGQLWQILTPLLNAGVYFLIFGLLLKLSRGVPNYLDFVITGVFVFNFTQRSLITTSNVVIENLHLIRALRFPRAALPLGYVMIELQQMMLSLLVLAVILLFTGEGITWYWLLAVPVLLLQTAFNIGCGLASARLGANVNDFSQLLPFLMRTWLYASGVLFQISTLDINHRLASILQLNPAAIYITLMRQALLITQRQSQPGAQPYNQAKCEIWQRAKTPVNWSAYCHPVTSEGHFWIYGIAWAALALVVGFWFFWRAEAHYGRG